MRALWTIVRVAVVLLALATLGLVAFWVGDPSGTTIDPQGALIDALALAALIIAAASLWRDRSRLL